MSANYDPEKYERNKMDITEQTASFAGFMTVGAYTMVATTVVLLFLLVFYT